MTIFSFCCDFEDVQGHVGLQIKETRNEDRVPQILILGCAGRTSWLVAFNRGKTIPVKSGVPEGHFRYPGMFHV